MDENKLADTIREAVKAERRQTKSIGVRDLIQRAGKIGELHVPCDIFHIATLLAMGAEPVSLNSKTSSGEYGHIVIIKGRVYSARTKEIHEELNCYSRG